MEVKDKVTEKKVLKNKSQLFIEMFKIVNKELDEISRKTFLKDMENITIDLKDPGVYYSYWIVRRRGTIMAYTAYDADWVSSMQNDEYILTAKIMRNKGSKDITFEIIDRA